MNQNTDIKVTSHVGRDLLASAAIFKNDAAAVWEYVSNSLQYVDSNVCPVIQVTISNRSKMITVSDNGRGMDTQDLKSFFTMHGENLDRMAGRPGRGKFGTGKSAAFGIGEHFCVDTVKNKIRNVIELQREDIKNSTGEDIPLNWITKNESIDRPNGTIITISNIFLNKINSTLIIDYIERNLPMYRAMRPEIAVNEHICELREPGILEEYEFSPSGKNAEILGNIKLIVKVSPVPLTKTEQGIAISAGLGNLVAIETGGIENKELGNYLFGEVDVPVLETFESPIEPYDSTRSMQLNTLHPISQTLVPFIGSKLEEVRRIHANKLKEARKSEQSRRLAHEADKIANILNNDFREIMNRLDNIRAVTSKAGNLDANFGSSNDGDTEEGVWIEGTQSPGKLPESESNNKSEKKDDFSREDPDVQKEGDRDENGNVSVDPAGGNKGKRKKPRGGFKVEYRNLGRDSDRSKYDKTTLTILINLDHPAVNNAISGSSVEDINFKRLSYEIAFTEYSIAFGYALADEDPDIPADDLLYDVRSTLNRVCTSAASLYSA